MSPRLIALAGPLAGTALPLSRQETTVGRDEANDLALTDPAVASRQCVLVRLDDRVVVRDCDSRTPTFVNGLPAGERALQDGDEIQLGDSLFVLRLDPDQAAAPEVIRVDGKAGFPPEAIVLRREDVFAHAPSLYAGSHERLSRDLATLVRASAAINAVRGLVALERPVIELIADAVPARRGALLFVGDRREITSAVGWNRAGEAAPAVHVQSAVVDRVLQDMVGVLCAKTTAAPGGEVNAVERRGAAGSVLAAPLVAFDKLIGAIVLESDDRPSASAGEFDEGHLRLVMVIAGVAATAFEHARQMELLESTNRMLRAEVDLHHNMVGESLAMQEVYRRIARVAPTDSTVLITGESGTGKELVARAIHRNSHRTQRPFVAINCAAITETLLESELFGYEKGAFTGAVTQKKGKLEVAEGGTVFLDEIGELSPALQAKLLRVLQDRVFDRVGGTRPVRVDFRLLAATNRDLKAAIDEGVFRRDLYYRLNVVSLAMPPLRERREDITPLAGWFLRRHHDKAQRQISGFAADAVAALAAYDWPGNVRELENAVEHAVILGQDSTIGRDDLPDGIAELFASRAGPDASSSPAYEFRETIQQAKIDLITKALQETGGNYTAAAHLLGLHPNYLHRLIRNLGMRASRR
jgi:transcriptional regulator with GAF, ATPase, and Fis domain